MIAYLSFDGCCDAALDFYAACLGGRKTMRSTYAEAPASPDMPAPPDAWKDRIMHARLEACGLTLMGSDMPPGMPFEGYKGFTLTVPARDKAEGERLFRALSDGGKVTMPYGATFWSPGFGMLVDRFGVPWMVNTEPAAA
ncbi:VOC family protein [Pelomonas sp. APW6]|uniref:VOC family protein n=1 Tax=Roseateles subflavus TaxID=3053353 RepID=A0ABT7LGR9_9BURK|nr:VOC family protein [Pelomonas sp. APW6]MDL5032063.1 VOC family protein [Pelomonas sp. APW6]